MPHINFQGKFEFKIDAKLNVGESKSEGKQRRNEWQGREDRRKEVIGGQAVVPGRSVPGGPESSVASVSSCVNRGVHR